MRVLFVIDGLGTGGTERSLAEMLPGLRSRGLDVAVACLHARSRGVEQSVRSGGISVSIVSGRTALGRARELVQLIRRDRPDLVHSMIFDANLAARLAAARASTPHVTSLVNTSYDPIRFSDPNIRPWRLRAIQAVDALSSRLTTHFHAVTRAVRDSAVRDLRLDPARITVIYRGRDVARLGEPSLERRLAVRRRLDLDLTAPVVVSVGRQEFQKGHEHLLRAFGKLLSSHSEARLLIAGRKGAATKQLERLVSDLALGSKVRLLGFRDDVPDLVAAADVFAFPSLFEGIGGAILEAMALGVPIVSSRLDGLAEVLTHEVDGLFVTPGDPDSLCAAISRVLSSEELASRLGLAARSTFADRFDLSRAVDRMIEMYQHVLHPGLER